MIIRRRKTWLNVVIALLLIAAGCAPAPAPPAQQPKPEPTAEDWYAPAVERLASMGRQAETLLKSGRADDAAKIVTDAQSLINKVLAAPHPTLAAMEAASDLDDLYGRMLAANGRYGWARQMFQKNVMRWKNWQPQTPETARRLKQAQSEIADCDRRMAAQ